MSAPLLPDFKYYTRLLMMDFARDYIHYYIDATYAPTAQINTINWANVATALNNHYGDELQKAFAVGRNLPPLYTVN